MRISHKHGFLFLSLPRAASLTVRKLLDPYSDIKSKKITDTHKSFPFWHHTKASEAKKIFKKKKWEWNSYKKFCLVRNPFDRVVSAYKKRWEKNYGWHSTGRFSKDMKSLLRDILLGRLGFEEFVLNNDPKTGYTISIEEFAYDKSGDKIVDDILIFENLPSNLAEYLERNIGLRVSKDKIKHYHKSNRTKNYKEWYNIRTKKTIEKQYRYELEKFGYEF